MAALAALLTLGVLFQQIALRRQRRRFAPPGRMVDVGGHRLHVACAGSGSPVVVLESGIAASSLSWSVVQPRIAMFTRACCTIVPASRGAIRHRPRGHSTGSWMSWKRSSRTSRRASDTFSSATRSAASSCLRTPCGTRHGWRGSFSWIPRPNGPQLRRIGRGCCGVANSCHAWAHCSLTSASSGPAWRFSPEARRARRGGSSGSLGRLPPARWSGSSVRCGSFRPRFIRSCRPSGAIPSAFTRWRAHLSALERDRESIAAVAPPREVPLVVISSAAQPPELLAVHRTLADASLAGRHVVAARSAHWIQFDEPELVVNAVIELLESTRLFPAPVAGHAAAPDLAG